MKAYKVELLIVDHDGLGSEEIKEVIENQRYPNHCIAPDVMNIVEKEIGEWNDDHPLNYVGSVFKEYERLFSASPVEQGWVSVEDYDGTEGRIVTFSPIYPENDPMRYRIIDTQFLSTCKDVTHYFKPHPPKTNN